MATFASRLETSVERLRRQEEAREQRKVQRRKKLQARLAQVERIKAGKGRTLSSSLTPANIDTALRYLRGEVDDQHLKFFYGSTTRGKLRVLNAVRDLTRDGYLRIIQTPELDNLRGEK